MWRRSGRGAGRVGPGRKPRTRAGCGPGRGGTHRVSGHGASGFDRVVEGPVVTDDLTGESGAGGVGVAANRDDGLDGAVEEFVEVFGAVVGDVQANFVHEPDGGRVDVADRSEAGALDFEQLAGGAQDGIGDVAAAGAAGA